MQVNVERKPGSVAELRVEVEPEVLARHREALLKDYAGRLNIPGFRKGKAPVSIVRERLGEHRIQEEAVDRLVEEAYLEALDQVGLTPLERAQVQVDQIKQGEPVSFRATVTVRPEVQLGEYRELPGRREPVEVTGEQVEAEIEKLRATHARFVQWEEPIVQGDLVVVDYAVIKGGQPEQTTSGYPLQVGSDQLFPQLNDLLLGARVGEKRRMPMPAGEESELEVEVKSVQRSQLPPLDDEFVRGLGYQTVETVEQLRDRVRQVLERAARELAETSLEEELVNRLVEDSYMDLPDSVVEAEVQRRASEITSELEAQGMSTEGYLRRRGLSSRQEWLDQLTLEVRTDLRRAMALDELARREQIKVSEEEIRREVQQVIRSRKPGQRAELDRDEIGQIANRLRRRRAIQFLVERAKLAEPEAVESKG